MRYRVRREISAGVLACVTAGCGGGGPAEGMLQNPPEAPPTMLTKEAVDAMGNPAKTRKLLQSAPRTEMAKPDARR